MEIKIIIKSLVNGDPANGLRCTTDNRTKNSTKSTFKNRSLFLYIMYTRGDAGNSYAIRLWAL